MKRKFLLPFAFVLLIGCTGSESDKTSPAATPDGLQEFSTVMGYLNKLGQSVDTATMMIDDNMAAKSNLDDLAQKLFGGLKLCDCMQHYTGQAHTHSKSVSLASGSNFGIGVLKIFEEKIDTDRNVYFEPCYFPYLNNNGVELESCEHIVDSAGNAAYDVFCVGNIKVAYNLRPIPNNDHTDIPDCHQDEPAHKGAENSQ